VNRKRPWGEEWGNKWQRKVQHVYGGGRGVINEGEL